MDSGAEIHFNLGINPTTLLLQYSNRRASLTNAERNFLSEQLDANPEMRAVITGLLLGDVNLYNMFKLLGVVGAELAVPFLTEEFNRWCVKVDGKFNNAIPTELNPTSLTYWIASDGYFDKRDGVIVLSTDSFTASKVDQLRNLLLTSLNIKSTLGRPTGRCLPGPGSALPAFGPDPRPSRRATRPSGARGRARAPWVSGLLQHTYAAAGG